MGLLDGGLAQSIYDGFKGKLLTATLYQYAVPESGGLDESGDPVALGTPTPVGCEGFIDLYSAYSHATSGIPETDLKVCLFAKSMPGVRPVKDNLVEITGPAGSEYVGRWFQLRKKGIDPAGALWECQSFEIKEPTWP